MSRSNPALANPCTRWMQWKGSDGVLVHYDKQLEENQKVALPFRFLLLDVLSTVSGWSEATQSAIYANEVHNTKTQPLNVRSFKGGTIAAGLYQNIKDKVNAAGAKFTQNCYLVYQDEDGGCELGSLKLKGAALNAWIEFTSSHRNEIYEKGIEIDGFTEGKKGAVTYRVPSFKIVDTEPSLNQEALVLDKTLQSYLKSYSAHQEKIAAEEVAPADDWDDDDDEIPF